MTTTTASRLPSVDAALRDRLAAALSVLRTRGVGPVRLRRALGEAHRRGMTLADSITDANRNLWSAIGAVPASPGRDEYVLADRLVADGVTVLVSGEGIELPERAPPVLFAHGAVALLAQRGIGFCGSRKATDRGVEVARDIASQLAETRITVVSGGARGVDTAAHEAALKAGGATVIVLAEGIAEWKPRPALRSAIDPARTLVISEFHPTDRWMVGRAMQRNNTICALSAALVLIEARSKGGTFAAGESALRMGLPLFCAVYANESEASDGNRILLARGAHPLKQSRASGRANVASILEAARGAKPSVRVASSA